MPPTGDLSEIVVYNRHMAQLRVLDPPIDRVLLRQVREAWLALAEPIDWGIEESATPAEGTTQDDRNDIGISPG